VYGVIYLWRVKPDRLAEHAAVMAQILNGATIVLDGGTMAVW
jgi:hypothetical protein